MFTGGIDPHTHLAMEFMGTETIDDFFSGQAAALAGGTTMHIDFVIPVNGSLVAGVEAYEKKAVLSCMDYGFHMAVTKWDESVSAEMEIMVKEKGWIFFNLFSLRSFLRQSNCARYLWCVYPSYLSSPAELTDTIEKCSKL